MRHIEGFVFHAILNGTHVLYGKGREGENERFCNLVMNKLLPYGSEEEAEVGLKAFKLMSFLDAGGFVSICRLRMQVAETDEEIIRLAVEAAGGDVVIIGLNEWGDHVMFGPPSRYLAVLSEPISDNGFKFYNMSSFDPVSRRSFSDQVIYRASEIVRQGQMPAQLATIEIKEA